MRLRAVKWVTGTSVAGGAAVTLALCIRDRHGPFTAGEALAPSKLELYMNPAWHLRAGVAVVVTLVEQSVRARAPWSSESPA